MNSNNTVQNDKTNLHAKKFWHIIAFIAIAWIVLVVLSLLISQTATLLLIKGLPSVAIGLFVKLPIVLGIPALIMIAVCRFFMGIKHLSKLQEEIIDENNGGLGSFVGLVYLALVLATVAVVLFS